MNNRNFSIIYVTELRGIFWDIHPQFKREGNKKQNEYCTDIRVAFVDFVDNLRQTNQISEKLANRATL